MIHLDLRSEAAALDLSLHEIDGGPSSAESRVRLARHSDSVTIILEADDPNMLELLGGAAGPDNDKFIYEDDCLQIATCLPGQAEPSEFLLVNPYGQRRGSDGAMGWELSANRCAQGWRLEIEMPLPAGQPGLGLSLHRFFRGVKNEVHGLTDAVPHPLDASVFPVLALAADSDPEAVAKAYHEGVSAAQQQAVDERLAQDREKLAAVRATASSSLSLDVTREYARRRAEQPIPTTAGGLCWNEGYFQLALTELWEIDGDLEWMRSAADRIDGVWARRSDRIGNTDQLWQTVLPTWYDGSGGDNAMSLISGVILRPIARFLRLVNDHDELAEFRPRLAEWLPLCHEVVAVHDREWIELGDGSGTYLEPYPKGPRRLYPRGGSRITPLNRAFFLAIPILDLARITGREAYLDKARQMALFFKRNIQQLDNGSYVWEYEPHRYPGPGEDLSHGSCQLLFAAQCCREGIVFTEDDMRCMANTLEHNIFRYGDVPTGNVRGHGLPCLTPAVGAWSELCRFTPGLFPKIEAVVAAVLAGGLNDSAAGWCAGILTRLEKTRRLLG